MAKAVSASWRLLETDAKARAAGQANWKKLLARCTRFKEGVSSYLRCASRFRLCSVSLVLCQARGGFVCLAISLPLAASSNLPALVAGRDDVDRRLTAVLSAAGMTLPGMGGRELNDSVLCLLSGALRSTRRPPGGLGLNRTTLRTMSSAGEHVHKAAGARKGGAREMLVGALISNVQFDWKSCWSKEPDAATQASGCLFAAALHEYALLRSDSGGVHSRGGYEDAECGAEGSRGGAAKGKETVEDEAAGVMMSQARQRGEADLLLMCCHYMSPLLPADGVLHSPPPRGASHSGKVLRGAWWMRPNAVRGRALARLVCKSAGTSARGEELVQRVEAYVQKKGNQDPGAARLVDSDSSNDLDDPDMLDVCLWAVVLLGCQDAPEPSALAGLASESSGVKESRGALSTAAVRSRLLAAILHEKVPSPAFCFLAVCLHVEGAANWRLTTSQPQVRGALLQRRPWLLAHAAAYESRLCDLAMEEVRTGVREGVVGLLAQAGALAAGASHHPGWAQLQRACVLVGHFLVTSAATRLAACRMLEALVTELGEALAPLVAQSCLHALTRLMDGANAELAERPCAVPGGKQVCGAGVEGAARHALASTPLHRHL